MIESSPPHQATLPMTLFLAGPTGSGKSAVAVELAEMLDAEIVSSDAYQVYRELPILTAAPSPADRERVPHHMVSIIPVQRTGMPRNTTTAPCAAWKKFTHAENRHRHGRFRPVLQIPLPRPVGSAAGGRCSPRRFRELFHGSAIRQTLFPGSGRSGLDGCLQPALCGTQSGNRPCRRKTSFLLEEELVDPAARARLGHQQGCS